MVFLIIFAITCILLGYGIVYERQQAKKFASSYAERKLKRLKEQREKRKTKEDDGVKEDDDGVKEDDDGAKEDDSVKED